MKNNFCWPCSEINVLLFLCRTEKNGCNATRATSTSADFPHASVIVPVSTWPVMCVTDLCVTDFCNSPGAV